MNEQLESDQEGARLEGGYERVDHWIPSQGTAMLGDGKTGELPVIIFSWNIWARSRVLPVSA